MRSMDRRDRVEGMVHLEHLRTLILSDSIVGPYIWTLAPTEASGRRRLWLGTYVTRSQDLVDHSGDDVLSTPSCLARRRKAAGIPLRTVSLFPRWTPCPEQLGWVQDLEELRGCIGTFELLDDADVLLDWSVDSTIPEEIDTYHENCIRNGYDGLPQTLAYWSSRAEGGNGGLPRG